MNIKNKVIATVAFFALANSAYAQCEVGSTIFRDTLFGAGIGLGVGALVLVANETSTGVAPKLATASLIGAGVGALIGVVEISFNSSCGSGYASQTPKPGFSATPMFAFENTASNSTSKESFFKKLALGVNLEYVLD